MKKKLIMALFLVLNMVVWGQKGVSIKIYKAGETEHVGGQTFEYTTTNTEVDKAHGLWEKAKFHVFNSSNSDVMFRIKRKRIDVPDEWTDALCWPPYCYEGLNAKESDGYYITPSTAGNPAPNIGANTSIISSGSAQGSVAEIKPQMYPKNTGTTATYRYIVSDQIGGFDFDSVTVKVSFIVDPNASKASVNSLSPAIELTLSPNPTSDYVFVQSDGVKGTIRIVDVLGNVVYSSSFDVAKKINVSDYKHGIYFVSIQDASAKTVTKKLVVKD